MYKTHLVRIESDRHGIAYLSYISEAKAREAVERLRESARVWGMADGVERAITYVGIHGALAPKDKPTSDAQDDEQDDATEDEEAS